MLRERKLAHSFAGRRKNGVTQRRHKRRNAGLPYTSRRSVAIDQVDIRAARSLRHAGNWVIVEIRLIDRAVGRRNLAGARQTGAEDRRALELGAGEFWIGDEPRIDRGMHVRAFDLAVVVDFDLAHRRHISDEAAMDSDTHSASLTHFALAPAGLFGGYLNDAAQAAGIDRIGTIGRTVIRVVSPFEIDNARRSDQLQQIIKRVAPGRMRQLIGKGLHGEGMIYIPDRPQPSDPHVGFRRAVLDPQVGDVVWNVGPPQAEVVGIAVAFTRLEGGRDGREHRTLQPCGRLPIGVEGGLHIHRRYRVVVAELDIVLAAPDDFYRGSDFLRQHRGFGHVVGLRLAPEATAEHGYMAGNVVARDFQLLGHDVLHGLRVLRAGPRRQLAVAKFH